MRPDIRRNKWYRYDDDDRVQEVSFKEVKNDAFGGHLITKEGKEEKLRQQFWKRIFTGRKRYQFGWGGRTSSAYMLQYVKRSEISFLFDQ